jgi:hypothetical protein
MSLRLLILAIALVIATKGLAQQVPASALSSLALEFATARAASERPGSPQQLRLTALPGDRLALQLPFVPNRIEPLVADGAQVSAGEAVARISGPELALWLLEARTVATRFADAERRYERNRALYEQQALDAGTWLSIAEQYRQLRVEEHHVRHALEWMDLGDDGGGESALLRAPQAGLLMFAEPGQGGAETPLLSIIDPASLRLTGWVSVDADADPVGVSAGDCNLAVSQVEARVAGFSRRVWSEAIGDCIAARPGLRVGGRLRYAFAGYVVPRAAVFRYEGQTRVAIRDGGGLLAVAVTIAGEDSDNYYIEASHRLDGREVLSRSTSALQGVLMGLGGEG